VQAVLSESDTTVSVSASAHNAMWNAFSVFNFLVIVSTTFHCAIFVLAASSLGLESRKLMLCVVFVLPIAGMLLWSTGAATYGLWIASKDVCAASVSYFNDQADGIGSRLSDAVRAQLVPCPAPKSAALLELNGKQAYLALVRRANLLVSGAC
jgi:hypothetical protein